MFIREWFIVCLSVGGTLALAVDVAVIHAVADTALSVLGVFR